MLQPAAALGQVLEGFAGHPAHAAAQVQLLLALQGVAGVLEVGQHRPQLAADRMGGQVAERIEGIDRAQLALGRQFAGQQQQQLAQLQGQAAAQQAGFMPGQAVERQQQLLLQHPFATILAAETADHGGDGTAAQGAGDQRVAGVIASHHHLLLAQQQVGQRVLELGVHQLEGRGGAPHHAPFGLGQGAVVHLPQQIPQQHGLVLGALQLGGQTQAQAQQFEHLGLLLQGGALPQSIEQVADRAVLELLLLAGGQRRALGAGQQGRGGDRLAHRRGAFGGQGVPAALAEQLRQGCQLHRHPIEQTALQLLAQAHKGIGVAAVGRFGHRDQQQG